MTPPPAEAAVRLAATGRVRVEMPLGEEMTRGLHAAMSGPDMVWNRAIRTPFGTDVPAAVFDAQDPAEKARLIAMVHEEAAAGFQFIYDRLRLGLARTLALPLPAPLDGLHAFFNTPEWLDWARTLTGDDRIVYVDAQATRYLPGHFLNGHDDRHEDAGRLYAYVLNLTPRWRPEWGGLLAFTDDEGDVTQTFAPAFGTLNVFRVPQPHLVTQVADFAPEPRFSVTGWWRTTPPPSL
ncbi:MAG: 2OG-Fe(II) oxygenase [Caulobacteraceae bacterium]|nr:2OG-Fe(II) oxygenase [Caulobacteraceae bacterium]